MATAKAILRQKHKRELSDIPSYRERLRQLSPEFARAEELVRKFARMVKPHHEKWTCFRTLTLRNYRDELERWEDYGGFDPTESHWGRFVCTINPFLPHLLGWKEPLGFTGLGDEPVLMMEVVPRGHFKCAKYSEIALGKHPVIMCKPREDFYVAQDDLLLAECWSESFVPITRITRIYLNPEAPEDAKEYVRRFAKKHGIPLVEGLPSPDDPEWKSPISKEELLALKKYLYRRRTLDCFGRVEDDPVATALAEAYDEELFREPPLGAADAIYQRNRRRRAYVRTRRPPLLPKEYLPPESCDLP